MEQSRNWGFNLTHMTVKKHYIILISLIATLSVLFFLIAPSWIVPKNTIISEIDNGTRLSGSRTRKVKNGWQGYVLNDRTEIVATNTDIFNPVYSILQERKSSNYISIQVIYLKRTGILDFKVIDYNGVFLYNKTFEEAVEMAKQQDLSTLKPITGEIKVDISPFKDNPEKIQEGSDVYSNPDYQKLFEKCLEETTEFPNVDICQRKVYDMLKNK